MIQRTPIRRKRAKPRVIHPERSGGHKRERLHGKAREQRRAEIFTRAQGRCEEIIEKGSMLIGNARIVSYGLCGKTATEWSHAKHGPRKCDCMACGIASCHDCHVKRHNSGGKPITVTKKSLSFGTEVKDGEK